MITIKEQASISFILKVAVSALVLFIAGQICIPFYPVPFTLQSLTVLIIGLCYSRSLALSTVSTYIILGASGLPIFANFLPLSFGPTSGYILGFLLATYTMTTLKEKLQVTHPITYGCIGTACIYLCGISWLAIFIGIPKAVQVGLVPFAFSCPLKIIIAAYAFKVSQQYLKKEI